MENNNKEEELLQVKQSDYVNLTENDLKQLNKLRNKQILDFHNSLTNKNDAEIKKYIGDLFYNKEDYYTAEKWYRPAIKGNNGMLLLDMRKKGFC